jgi:hypothetical protein
LALFFQIGVRKKAPKPVIARPKTMAIFCVISKINNIPFSIVFSKNDILHTMYDIPNTFYDPTGKKAGIFRKNLRETAFFTRRAC